MRDEFLVHWWGPKVAHVPYTPYTPVRHGARLPGWAEEFSIAKYFTLREMGIDNSKLRLTYTEIESSRASHMVLAYYSAVDAEPLVLDYLDKAVRPLSQRQDIRLIYSFDAEPIWLSQSNARTELNFRLARSLRGPYKPVPFQFRPVATMDSTHY